MHMPPAPAGGKLGGGGGIFNDSRGMEERKRSSAQNEYRKGQAVQQWVVR